MKKSRLLIPITVQFSVRYVLRTGLLEKLQNFVQPIIVLGWQDEDLTNELRSMGVEVYQNPHKKTTNKYSRIRIRINNWHKNQLDSCTTKIDRRRARLTRSSKINLRLFFRNLLYTLEGYVPERLVRWKTSEESLLYTDTNFSEHINLIREIDPDFIFCTTPYFLEEELLLRAAKSLKIPMSTAILSFDNLTTRGYIPIIFDEYYLWNQYNKNELLRIYPEAADKKIEIVGAPQFDFYYRPGYIWDEDEWRRWMGIEKGRKVILYGAGPNNITPYEQLWVEQIDEAIKSGEIEGNPIMLLRRHPVDPPERWQELQKILKNTIFDSSWHGEDNIGKTNISQFDLQKLASTLKYSDVHVNVSSTMTIDGAIFDRPQIGPAYDDRHGRKYDKAMFDLYFREHFLPITESGGLDIARSRDQLIHFINLGLKIPSRLKEERKEMVKRICTYSDGKATERLAGAIINFVEQ